MDPIMAFAHNLVLEAGDLLLDPLDVCKRVVKAYEDVLESQDSTEAHYTPSDSTLPGQDSTPPSWSGATTTGCL